MQKINMNFFKSAKGLFGKRGLYVAMCVGVLAVSLVTAAGYKSAMKLVTQGLAEDDKPSITNEVELDKIDEILKEIEKEQNEAVNSPKIDEPDLTDELKEVAHTAYYLPINGEVITEFSGGELIKTSGNVWRTHDGVDILGEIGKEVKTMTRGKVKSVYSDSVWGNCVVIDHDNTLESHYYGLANEIMVSEGDEVSAGQIIGYLGNTADIESDLAPHLHFGVKQLGEWVDPISLIEPYK